PCGLGQTKDDQGDEQYAGGQVLHECVLFGVRTGERRKTDKPAHVSLSTLHAQMGQVGKRQERKAAAVHP
ncbi:MAG: hypothetical protein OXC63_02340, partial [Aestuariivita sp.]|nr:hypothetical protein [Aestuariivita sp.]